MRLAELGQCRGVGRAVRKVDWHRGGQRRGGLMGRLAQGGGWRQDLAHMVDPNPCPLPNCGIQRARSI